MSMFPQNFMVLQLSDPDSNKPSEFFVTTAWQWWMSFPYMPCIPMQIKPIKACQGKGWGACPLRQ